MPDPKFKIGDKVKITEELSRIVELEIWCAEMNDVIEYEGIITDIGTDDDFPDGYCYYINFGTAVKEHPEIDFDWAYPQKAMELINPKIKPDS